MQPGLPIPANGPHAPGFQQSQNAVRVARIDLQASFQILNSGVILPFAGVGGYVRFAAWHGHMPVNQRRAQFRNGPLFGPAFGCKRLRRFLPIWDGIAEPIPVFSLQGHDPVFFGR